MYEEETGASTPKILAVPMSDPAWNDLEDVHDLPGNLADEIVHFFKGYSDLEGDMLRSRAGEAASTRSR